MVFLDPLGVPFHPATVFGFGPDFLLKSTLRHCAYILSFDGWDACVFVVVVVDAEFEFVDDFVFSFEKRYGRQPFGSGSGTESSFRS